MINKKRLVRLTQELIRMDSQNPPGNEYKIAHFVKDRLQAAGLRVGLYEFSKKRSNVVAWLKGKKSTFSLLITPHLDTVPAGSNWKFNPFGAKIYKGKIYGRGATDCKGNLACGIEAIQSLKEEDIKLDYDIIFAACADEESGSQFGIIPLLKKKIIKPNFALILDADEFKIIVAQKGLIHLKVSVFGKKAHGAYPWRGINAIEISSNIINRLKKHRFHFKRHPLLHPPTLNIGTIHGGDKVNIVADWCEFELDFRFLPGMEKEVILKDIKKIVGEEAKKFKINIQSIQAPYEIEKNHPLVAALRKVNRQVLGRENLSGSEGATVITFFQELNIPAVAYGCGEAGCAHVSDEYIKINNLYKGAYVLEEFLKNFGKVVRP
ncbi:MAG: M20 family metallopeptidase [Candidatus Omnitrophica bacterium]|nr:M20 family metallopeptidase [Candidatus Omnitrophota bacterium]